MPSFEELAAQYASRIRVALGEDRFSTKAFLGPGDVRSSRTLAVLKTIDGEINGLVMSDTKKPLTPEQKRRIYEGIARELGLVDLTIGEAIVKAASNDDITDLVNYIDRIIRGQKDDHAGYDRLG